MDEKDWRKSAYVLDDRGLYGKGLADVFSASAPDFGIAVLGREGIDPKAQEYRSLMTKIKALNPDFIYYGGTTQTNAYQIAKDMVAVGLAAKIMVPDGCLKKPLSRPPVRTTSTAAHLSLLAACHLRNSRAKALSSLKNTR